MLNFNFDKHCYGCAACANICPKNAIKMEQNAEGFYNPVIDEEKCINCGLCDKACIYLKENNDKNNIKNAKYFAIQMKEINEVNNSTSGGAFWEIAKKFIENGGFVCGCIWNDNMVAKHVLSNNIDIVKKMRGSKYVQSYIGSCYKEIKMKLNEGKKVLFSGTPCQSEALVRSVGRHENLYICSLICEGVPSIKVWNKYREYLEKKQKSKMISADFRNKEKYGWYMPISRYKFENGRTLENLSFNLDIYISSFVSGALMNSICYECKYKKENIDADFIIGDFWGFSDENSIPEYKKKGISAIILLTDKAQKIFAEIHDKYIVKEVKYEDIEKYNPNLKMPIKKYEKRDEIYCNIDILDFNENIMKNTNINSIKKKCIKILYKLNIINLIRK